MALTIVFRYAQPTVMRAQVGGLNPTYAYGRYVTWEYKKVGTTKWYNVEDDDGLIVETRIEIGSYVSELVVITGLRPGTSYQLRAKIFSDNGDILTPDYITSEAYTTLEAPIIDSFNVYDTEIGSLSFDWDMSWSQCYVGTTEFEIRARHLGEEEWCPKLSGLVEDGVSYDKITVNDFGTYEFQLVLITYEVEAESSIVTATAASATYDVYCYMSSQNGASPNIASCTVSVPRLSVESTEVYNQDGRDLSVTKVPNGYSVTFEATPADGYVFTHWVYHIGGATATQIISEENPLTINNPSGDIFIRAEGVSILESFTIEQTTIDIKEVNWECTLNGACDEPIKYKIMAAYGIFVSHDDYYQISSGTIPAGEVTVYNNFTVDKFGIWHFALVLTIDGEEIISETQYVLVEASPIKTSDFNFINTKGSKDITIEWKTNRKHEGTTYYIRLIKVDVDGSSSLVSSKQTACYQSNSEFFQVAEYGTYCVSILYQVDGSNFGENYRSDNFVIEEAELGYPSNWQWTSPMEDQLTVTEDGQIHPVTASEWNTFTKKLMELKEYLVSLGYGFSGFPSSFSKAEPEAPITDLYNEVSSAMLVLCNNSYGNVDYIYTPIHSGTDLEAKLFTSLQNNYNYIVNNL